MKYFLIPGLIVLITVSSMSSIFAQNLADDDAQMFEESKGLEKTLEHPLRQIKNGVALTEVKCSEGKIPVYKYNKIRVACVSNETEKELEMRGWADTDLEWTLTNSISMDLCVWYGGAYFYDNDECGGLKDPLYCTMLGGEWNATCKVYDSVITKERLLDFNQNNCKSFGGTWLPEYNECSDISNSQCSQIGVAYSIESSCRHTNNDDCVRTDVPVCLGESFNNYESETNESGKTVPKETPPKKTQTSELRVDVTGEKQVRRGTTHDIHVMVTKEGIPIPNALVIITIEDYGEDIIRDFKGHTDRNGKFVFSWEIPKSFDDIETLLAYVDVTDNISSKTILFKFLVYCLPGETGCKVEGN